MHGLIAIGLLLASGLANAASIIYEIGGLVTSINDGLVTDMSVGDSYSIRVTIDSDTPDLDPDINDARYAGHYIYFDTDSYSAESLGPPNYSPEITIRNEWSGTTYDLLNINSGLERHNGPLQGNRDLVAINVQLRDNDATVFSDESLPTNAPSLSEFENTEMSLLFSNDYTADTAAFDAKWVYGSITSISIVPIPAAIWMFASGLAGLCLQSVRRQRCNRPNLDLVKPLSAI